MWVSFFDTYNVPRFKTIIISKVILILFMVGIHRRVIATSIITQRVRNVLGDFNMSCDDTGKLILKPTRPSHLHES
ncbi:hypothetical protein TSAR_015559 [Trichomalopsis sarcophagae]|uniref:Transmembrane protein 188 n=1 Tax=Trichomalopsis sarcophagae TaxID=543379 RepID=A0A232EI38_9HYME|nr:hypothetical protein TSAR_015559 [Trichomalopsis sarcophagae]